MSVFSAYLNLAGLTDVGYRFYDVAEAGIGSRTQTGVRDVGDGWYSVDVTMPASAVSVRWDSAANATTLCAREYLSVTVDNNAIAAAVWQVLVSALTGAGTVGKLLADNLGADTAGTTTLLSRIASALTITTGMVDVSDKSGFSLTAAYDAAKSAASQNSVNLLPAATRDIDNTSPIPGSFGDDAHTAAIGGGGEGATPEQIADAVLTRDWTEVTGEATSSLLQALRSIRNRWTIDESGVLKVYKEDGVTIAWQRNILSTTNAVSVVGME